MNQDIAFTQFLVAVESGTLEEIRSWARVCINIEEPKIDVDNLFESQDWFMMQQLARTALGDGVEYGG